MKLLIITAVQSFQEDIKSLLKTSGIKTYSRLEVTGFKELPLGVNDQNWFATTSGEHRSVMFYSFVEEGLVEDTLNAIQSLNEQQETHSHVHAAVIAISQIV